MDPVEVRAEAIGRELYERVRRETRAFRGADRWASRILEWSLDDEAAKLQLFRFIDVLPALADDREMVRHLREYLADRPGPFRNLVRVGLGVARAGWPGEKLVALALRLGVRRLARRFIAGSTHDEVLRVLRGLRRQREAFTLDLLGEACVSEKEAQAYQQSYLELVERFTAEAGRWPEDPLLDRASWGRLPRVNVSVKLTALYPYLDPVAPAASAEAVKSRLRPILRAAQARGAHVQIDMEERRGKDLTFRIFRELAEEDEFRRNRNLGVVLQAYLTDAEQDVETLIAWARARGTPVTIRLVKGAYWDYETAHAGLEGWPPPVHEAKSHTDAAFERLTRRLLEHAGTVDVAVGSHNVRSIAHAMACREVLALPRGQVEFQMLYGMAGALARALERMGERVRIYAPFGELLPGMAYLVRRLLENTSNESFLRRGFAEGGDADTLLLSPERQIARLEAGAPSRMGAPAGAAPGFRNEPHTDWALEEERRRLATAIAAVRRELGGVYPLIIDGEPVETGGQIASSNPALPDEVIGYAASASAEDVDRAVVAAERAFPGWREAGAAERVRRLRRAAAILRERRHQLAAWMVLEAGKPWREADADVAEAVDFLEYYSAQAEGLQEPVTLGGLRGEINRYRREPLGVAGIIAPWNFPLSILAGMTSAALVTGNTVVMKPAEQTPVIAAKLAAVFQAAGIPAGVVNYVPGAGEVAGDRLVRHPAVRLIAFTGSRAVGMEILSTAAQPAKGARHLKRVIAEMGGKNAIIVDDDADLDEAVQGIIASAFSYAGQKCSACSRVIPVGRVADRLLERLVEAARTVPLGPPEEPATVVGPLIEGAARERVLGYLELGKRLARPALLRELPPECLDSGGHYVPPAIFAEVSPSCPLAQEEIFGPVLAVVPARDFEQAIELAMDVDYALTGGVFSRSPAHLRRAHEAFRVGNLYLNRGITGAMVGRQPFGGRQLSGIGHQAGGPDYLSQFVEGRVVTENTLRRGFASQQLE